MSVITINGNSFDPAGNAVHAFGLESVDASQSNYILIQTSGGPLKREQKEALREKDVKIHEYVSKDTYLCGYKPEDLSAIRDLDFIQYANVYLPEFVVQPSLKTDLGSAAPGVQSVFVESDTASRAPRTVDIILHQDVESSAALNAQIAAIAHADPDAIQVRKHAPKLKRSPLLIALYSRLQMGKLDSMSNGDISTHWLPLMPCAISKKYTQ
jgi:hypothetical protein